MLCWYSVFGQPKLLLSKVNTVDVIFCCSVLFVQPGMQLISDMSMSIYSTASIAENYLLAFCWFYFQHICNNSCV